MNHQPAFTVLHIGDEMAWRGGENQILQLARGLKKHRVRSIIAYPKGSQALSKFAEEFEVIALPSRKPIDFRNLWELKAKAQSLGVDLIDTHSSNAMSMGLQLKRALPHLKLVVHRRVAHAVKTSFFSRRKYLSSQIDRYVAISSAIAEVLYAYGIPQKHVAVVKSAVDGAKYVGLMTADCRAQLHPVLSDAAANPLWVGYAGAMTSEKGIDTFLRSLQILKQRGVSFYAPIAGGGPLREQYQKLSESLGLGQCVEFFGHLDIMPQFLTALDILVVPSRLEGLGTIILDGMLAGAAIVGSRVGGIPETVIDGVTGCLASPDRPDEFASAIEKLMADPVLRQQLVHNAQVHIDKNFSLEAMVNGNLQIYEEVLARG